MAVNHLVRIRPTLCAAKRFQLSCRARHISKASTSAQEVFHSQLEDPSSASFLSSFKAPPSTVPQTLTEKLFQRHALDLPESKFVRSGDFITLSPHRCMTHDNSWPVATKFMEMGATNIHDPQQVVMTLDHDVQNRSETNLKKYRKIEEFAKSQGVDFYPAGHGIGHQIMVEEGYAWPGSVAVASDSHSNMYGGVGCLGTPVVRTGAADIWATGTTWFKIPPVAKVTLLGTLPPGTTGKDVIVALCGIFNNDDVLNHAIEFVGSEESLRSLPIDDRLAIANMTTEWGALSGLFPIDSLLKGYLRAHATEAAMYAGTSLTSTSTTTRLNHDNLERLFAEPLVADPTARYAKSLYLDLSTVPPYVSGPNSVKVATPIHDLQVQKMKIDKAYLVSCTNSRASDLAAAAKVFKDATARGESSRIPDHVSLYIAAASAAEQRTAESEGDWGALLEAGAQPLPSGCGPCIGLGTGLLEPGEVGISASNRNFKGRMGSTDAKAYLASPEVVAASALKGYISAPESYKQPPNWMGVNAGEGDGIQRRFVGVEEALEKLIGQADDLVAAGEAAITPSSSSTTPWIDSDSIATNTTAAASPKHTTTSILPNFPTHINGQILFLDADNINTDAIYPGKYTYTDALTPSQMAEVCMSNYDASFPSLCNPTDILVAGYNFGCGSSREQAATAILACGVPLVVAGSFGAVFGTNSINNALMGLEVPRLVERLRTVFASGPETATNEADNPPTEPAANKDSLDSQPASPPVTPAGEKTLTRRTGWSFSWDVAGCVVEVREGEGKDAELWRESVPEVPRGVQEIVAGGGLVKARRARFAKKEEKEE